MNRSSMFAFGLVSLVSASAFAQTPADLDRIAAAYDAVGVAGTRLSALPAWSNGSLSECAKWQQASSAAIANAIANASTTCGAAATDAQTAINGAIRVCGEQQQALQQRLTACLQRSPEPGAPTPAPRPAAITLPVCISGPGGGGVMLMCMTRNGQRLTGDACTSISRAQLRWARCGCPDGGQPVSLSRHAQSVSGPNVGTFCAMVHVTEDGHREVVEPPAARDPALANRLTAVEERLNAVEANINILCTVGPGEGENAEEAPPEPAASAHDAAAQLVVNCARARRYLWQNRFQFANGGQAPDMTATNEVIGIIRQNDQAQDDDIRVVSRRINVFIGGEGMINPRGNNQTSLAALAALRLELAPSEEIRLFVGGSVGYSAFNGYGIPSTGVWGVNGGLRWILPGSTRWSILFGGGLYSYMERGVQPANTAVVGPYRGQTVYAFAGLQFDPAETFHLTLTGGGGFCNVVGVSDASGPRMGNGAQNDSPGGVFTLGASWSPPGATNRRLPFPATPTHVNATATPAAPPAAPVTDE